MKQMVLNTSMGALLGLVVVGTASLAQGRAPTHLSSPRKTGRPATGAENGLMGYASALSGRGLFIKSPMADGVRQPPAVVSRLAKGAGPTDEQTGPASGPLTNLPIRCHLN